MEVDLPPRLAPGAREVLEALHGSYRLGIVSDAIVTPGAQLREILAGYDLLRFFDVTVFSDEAGASKPDPRVFHVAAAGLGVDVTEIAHIGDRDANDIAGPHAAGAKGVLYTGVVDRGASPTADAVCTHHDDLPAILAALGA
jgi:putative hydrolase of the HAD superfamily